MTGQRFDFQQHLDAQRGGLSLYPYCGVISGLEVSSVVANGAGNVNLSLSVSAGRARLDGQLCTLASAVSALIIPVGADVTVGTQTFDIWLNPRRKVPAVFTAPSNPSTDDKYIKVLDRGSFLEVEKAFNYNGSAWVDYNMVKAPAGYSHNNLPLNELATTAISTATTANPSFALAPEKIVYHKTNYPVGLSSPGAAYLRYPASIKLATVTLVSGVATVVSYGDETRIPQ